MRELKFRAWDKKQKRWLETGFHILGEVTCFDIIGQKLREFHPGIGTLELLNFAEITQYTGLKDKNGKEIYEGDIIGQVTNGKVNKFKWLIEWGEYQKGFITKKLYGYQDLPPLILTESDKDLEVIDNIYENPELLK